MNLKSNIDKLDIGKLQTTVDSSKLSDGGKNEGSKKTEYDELVKKMLFRLMTQVI